MLELVEVCLDFDLQGNQLRVRFNGSPIVSVSAQETTRDVVFLVTTANSVHRLAFTHPALLQSHVRHTGLVSQLIYSPSVTSVTCKTRWFSNSADLLTQRYFSHM